MVVTNQKIAAHTRYLFLCQVAAVIVMCLLTACLSGGPLYPWIVGGVVNLLDSGYFLYTVRKGMKKRPEEAVQLMERSMLKRIAFLSLVSIVMLRLKLSVIGIFISFILLHIILILTLIIIANREQTRERFVKKGVD